MSGLIEHILSLSGWLALLIVFAVPALESSAFLGFVFPGETALILGGVLASYGRVSLWAVLVAGISGAIVGDSVGYLVGREYGRRLLESRPLRRVVKPGRIDRGQEYLARRGGRAVFFGRFTAALRRPGPGPGGHGADALPGLPAVQRGRRRDLGHRDGPARLPGRGELEEGGPLRHPGRHRAVRDRGARPRHRAPAAGRRAIRRAGPGGRSGGWAAAARSAGWGGASRCRSPGSRGASRRVSPPGSR